MSRGPGHLARAVLAELVARGGRASVDHLQLALALRQRVRLTRSLRMLDSHGLVLLQPAPSGRQRNVLLGAALTDRGRNYAGRTP